MELGEMNTRMTRILQTDAISLLSLSRHELV